MNRYTYLVNQLDLNSQTQGEFSWLYAMLKLAESLDPSDDTSGNLAAEFVQQLRDTVGPCVTVDRVAQLLMPQVEGVNRGSIPAVS